MAQKCAGCAAADPAARPASAQGPERGGGGQVACADHRPLGL